MAQRFRAGKLGRYKPRKFVQPVSRGVHPYGPDWTNVTLYVRKRDNYRCRISDLTRGRRICKNRFPPPFHHLLHAHHILERGRGGSDHPSNVITICCVCHGWLHNKPLGRITLKQVYAAQRVL